MLGKNILFLGLLVLLCGSVFGQETTSEIEGMLKMKVLLKELPLYENARMEYDFGANIPLLEQDAQVGILFLRLYYTQLPEGTATLKVKSGENSVGDITSDKQGRRIVSVVLPAVVENASEFAVQREDIFVPTRSFDIVQDDAVVGSMKFSLQFLNAFNFSEGKKSVVVAAIDERTGGVNRTKNWGVIEFDMSNVSIKFVLVAWNTFEGTVKTTSGENVSGRLCTVINDFSDCILLKEGKYHVGVYGKDNESVAFVMNDVFVGNQSLNAALETIQYDIVVDVSQFNFADADRDGIPDSIDLCQNSLVSIVDISGCDCSQKKCGVEAFCKEDEFEGTRCVFKPVVYCENFGACLSPAPKYCTNGSEVLITPPYNITPQYNESVNVSDLVPKSQHTILIGREGLNFIKFSLFVNESIWQVHQVLTENDLTNILHSGNVLSTNYTQELQFYQDGGKIVFGENEEDKIGHFLFWKDGKTVFTWRLAFQDGVLSNMSANELVDLNGQFIPLLGDSHFIVRAGFNSSTNETSLGLLGGDSLFTVLEKGGTSQFIIGGKEYLLEVQSISGSDKVSFSVDGEVFSNAREGDIFVLLDGLYVAVGKVVKSGSKKAVFLYYGTQYVEFQGRNAVTNTSGSVRINNETIEDAVVNINAVLFAPGKVKLQLISYGLLADSKLGDVYVPAGEGLRDQLDEPESMLSLLFDIGYEGIPTELLEVIPPPRIVMAEGIVVNNCQKCGCPDSFVCAENGDCVKVFENLTGTRCKTNGYFYSFGPVECPEGWVKEDVRKYLSLSVSGPPILKDIVKDELKDTLNKVTLCLKTSDLGCAPPENQIKCEGENFFEKNRDKAERYVVEEIGKDIRAGLRFAVPGYLRTTLDIVSFGGLFFPSRVKIKPHVNLADFSLRLNYTCPPKLVSSDIQCLQVIDNGPSEKRSDLLFVGDGYESDEQLLNDVREIIDYAGVANDTYKEGLFSIEPFKSQKTKFNVWAVNGFELERELTPVFGMWGSVPKTEDVYRVSVGCPHDYILVLSQAAYRSHCALGTGPCLNSIGEEQFKGRLVLHEFGHGFASLWDEYVQEAVELKDAPDRVETLSAFVQEVDLANCKSDEEKAKAAWGDLITPENKLGFFKGCGGDCLPACQDFVRPTKNSVMRDQDVTRDSDPETVGPPFDSYYAVNEREIQKVLDQFEAGDPAQTKVLKGKQVGQVLFQKTHDCAVNTWCSVPRAPSAEGYFDADVPGSNATHPGTADVLLQFNVDTEPSLQDHFTVVLMRPDAKLASVQRTYGQTWLSDCQKALASSSQSIGVSFFETATFCVQGNEGGIVKFGNQKIRKSYESKKIDSGHVQNSVVFDYAVDYEVFDTGEARTQP